jgi:SAM-dependent methyltransferase
MQQTWDRLARRDAMHFISTDRSDWDEAAFLASGRERLADLVARLEVDRACWRGVALDLGCGLGRFSFALAQDFEQVIGVDLSSEMIQQARSLAARIGCERVTFEQNSGADLAAIPSERCDLAFSYVVLQHIPDLRIVEAYIRELVRVLRPGGHLLFQVLTYQETPAAQLLRLVRPVLVRALRWLEERQLLAPEHGAAFQGSRMRLAELEDLIAASGLQLAGVHRRHQQHLLCDETVVYCRRA